MEVALEVALDSVEVVPFLLALTFFLWTFFVLVIAVEVVSVEVAVFCLFAACGAAIRNGTAATVKRVEVKSFFIVLFSLGSWRNLSPLTVLLCARGGFRAIG